MEPVDDRDMTRGHVWEVFEQPEWGEVVHPGLSGVLCSPFLGIERAGAVGRGHDGSGHLRSISGDESGSNLASGSGLVDLESGVSLVGS